MNTMAEQFKTAPHQVFDRLVDGELPDQQRRDLLALLDDEPGAWRSCALAFLEAQSWRDDLRAIGQELLAPPKPHHRVAAKPNSKWQLPSLSAGIGPLPLAACVLLSLAMGWQLAVQFGASRPSINTADLPHTESQDPTAGQHTPSLAASPKTPGELAADEEGLRTVQLNIADPHQGVSEAIELPVVEAEEFNAQWLAEQPSAVPPQLLEKLEQLGHRVTQNSQLWPIRLHDGRELLVPVEQLEVQFAKSYQ